VQFIVSKTGLPDGVASARQGHRVAIEFIRTAGKWSIGQIGLVPCDSKFTVLSEADQPRCADPAPGPEQAPARWGGSSICGTGPVVSPAMLVARDVLGDAVWSSSPAQPDSKAAMIKAAGVRGLTPATLRVAPRQLQRCTGPGAGSATKEIRWASWS
jgi:hypothetical protein